MVDEDRIVHLLRRVTDDIAILRRRGQQGDHTLLTDRDRLDALKYSFITALEGCIRVAQHVAASQAWEPPSTNADAFRVLAAHDVLDVQLARRLGAAAGFRNLLIHQYADIDDQRVVGNLDSLGDLDDFVDAVLAWMRRQPA